MEAPVPRPNLDRTAPEAELQKLPPRNHAVLALRERGDLDVPVVRPGLCTYAGSNPGFVRHAAQGGTAIAP
jgi:hypothetical protein